MADPSDTRRLADREGFVLWIEREAETAPGSLRGVLERSATSERMAFDSDESLLALLRGASSKPSHEKEKTR